MTARLQRWLKPDRCWKLLALFLPLLYLCRVGADSISGVFGIFWTDEGSYLLSAKNKVLFGQMHFFDGDMWRPELIAPWLHHYALLTMTQADTLLWLRFGIGVQVLCGAAIIAWIAQQYYRSTRHALACFVCMLLNPLLFFYARIGLSEGLQFFLLAIILATLFKLYTAGGYKPALLFSSLAGALVACLFIAKISAVAICAALTIGVASIVWTNASPTRKPLVLAGYVGCGLAVLAAYFLGVIGGQFPVWWHNNITMQASNRVPHGLILALRIFLIKWPDIAYYFALMPVFALYLISLILGADRSKGFVFQLWVITVSGMLLESCFGGDMRRNFFGFAMLGALSGFTILDYVEHGVRVKPLTRLKAVGGILILLHVLGMMLFLGISISRADMLYSIFCSVFLFLLLLLFFATGEEHAGTRRLLLAIIALCSLFPMLFSAFIAGNTRAEANAAIESIVPPDAVIIGQATPWAYAALKRRTIFTNCIFGNNVVDFTNDINTLPIRGDYYLGDDPDHDMCKPDDIDHYQHVEDFIMFAPANHGAWEGSSDHWHHWAGGFLYERKK